MCLPPSVIAVNGLDGGGAGENDDEPVLVSLSAAPSPQSEAVANELQAPSAHSALVTGSAVLIEVEREAESGVPLLPPLPTSQAPTYPA